MASQYLLHNSWYSFLCTIITKIKRKPSIVIHIFQGERGPPGLRGFTGDDGLPGVPGQTGQKVSTFIR